MTIMAFPGHADAAVAGRSSLALGRSHGDVVQA